MIQSILVILVFIAAVGYTLRMAYKAFFAKSGCTSGCSKCNAVDFTKIEQQLKERGL